MRAGYTFGAETDEEMEELEKLGLMNYDDTGNLNESS